MKCESCGKMIPKTSRVCPFCLTPIESDDEELEVLGEDLHDLTTIGNYEVNTNNNELNFGDLVNTSYNTTNDTVIGESKAKKKKKPIIPIILVLILIIGGIVFYIINKRDNSKKYLYFTDIVNELFDYVDNTYLKDNINYAGKYKLHYTYDNEKNDFTGTFELDFNKKVLNMFGELRATDPETGLVTNNSGVTFNINTYLNNTVLSIQTASSEPILLPYDDLTRLFTNNNYDALKVSNIIRNAINESLSEMSYTTEKKVELIFNGIKGKYTKISLKLDNNGKKVLLSSIYNKLINNDDFINEYKKINSEDYNTLKKRLSDYLSETERKYATDDSGNYIVINCYYKDDTKIYEIDLSHNDGNKYYVQHTKGKLIIVKMVDDRETLNLTISRSKETEEEKDKYIYSLEGKINDKKIIVKFEFVNDGNKDITPITNDNTKNIRNMSNDDLTNIANNLKKYTSYVDWIYELKELFDIKCSNKLKCTCVKKECTCTNGTYTRKCNKKDIE